MTCRCLELCASEATSRIAPPRTSLANAGVVTHGDVASLRPEHSLEDAGVVTHGDVASLRPEHSLEDAGVITHGDVASLHARFV